MKKNWSKPELKNLSIENTKDQCPFFNKPLVSTLVEVGDHTHNANGTPIISELCCQCSNYNTCTDAAGKPVNQIVTGCSV